MKIKWKPLIPLGIALYIVVVVAGYFTFIVSPPKAPDNGYNHFVTDFDDYMAALGYEHVQSVYEYYSDTAHSFYWGYAYYTEYGTAYARQSGERTNLYLPPELNPADYFYGLFPYLDFMLDRGGETEDGYDVYWYEGTDMALSIDTPTDYENEEHELRPWTLNYAKYVFTNYADAITAVYNHRDEGELRYYFEWNGPMAPIIGSKQTGDLWIAVWEKDTLNTRYQVKTTR